jgi:hypothetical protein
MAERIPQAVSYLVVFRAYLAADGKTPATGKTIAVTISKNGLAFGNPNVGALNATEIASGFYKFTLDATDTGTLGPLAWRGAEASINDPGDVLNVANPNNAGFAGVANAAAGTPSGLALASSTMTLAANQHVITDSGTITTVTNAVTLPAMPANWLTAAGLASDAVAEIVAGVWDEPITNHQIAGSTGATLSAGATGGGAGVQAEWSFIAQTTSSDPGNGKFKFNTASVATVSQIFLDRLALGNSDMSNYIRTFKSGDTVSIQETTNATNWIKLQLSAAPADQVGWYILGVTVLGSGGSLPAGNSACTFLFTQQVPPTPDPWAQQLPGAYIAGSAGYVVGNNQWTSVLTESYRGARAAGTPAQFLHEILQNLTEFAIAGTTKTVKKFNGLATAKTYTLDSASAPTAITEAT